MMKRLLFGLIFCAAVVATQAQTVFTVNKVTPDDGTEVGTLRKAIADARDGDIIRFAASTNGTAIVLDDLEGPLLVTYDITIEGNGPGNTIIDGNEELRHFNIQEGIGGDEPDVRIEGLTLTDGLAGVNAVPFNMVVPGAYVETSPTTTEEGGGSILSRGADLTIVNCLFINNEVESAGAGVGADNLFGGAILAGGGTDSRLTLENCTFENNKSDEDGGALAFSTEEVTITGCTFDNNEALRNGGAAKGGLTAAPASTTGSPYVYAADGNIDLTIMNTVFMDNEADDNNDANTNNAGSGLHTTTSNDLIFDGVDFDRNKGTDLGGGGGALVIDNADVVVVIDNGEFTNNTGKEYSAYAITAEKLNMDNVLVSGNTADEIGVGLIVTTDDAVFENSTFSNNRALTDVDGAVMNVSTGGASSKFDNCTFANNTGTESSGASGFGGALSLETGTLAEIENCTFTNNSIDDAGQGGAIWAAIPMTIEDSEFTGNSTTGVTGTDGGGAIFTNMDVTVRRSSFTNNEARGATEGGAMMLTGGTHIFRDSEFTGNNATALTNGGAVLLNAGDLDIESCSFTNNFVEDGEGGALHLTGGGIISMEGSTFTGNYGGGNSDGGAIFAGDVTMDVIQSTFANNYVETGGVAADGANASGGGGAIFINGDNILTTGEENNFTGNEVRISGDGGAIFIEDAAAGVTINQSIFSANSAADLGGAVYNETTVGIVDLSAENNKLTQFLNNEANLGGAIFNATGSAELIISEAVFDGNTSDEDGGAIWNDGVVLLIDQSDFFNNASGEHGGALYNLGTGTSVDILETAFEGNSAQDDGGAIWTTDASAVTIDRSLMAFNTADFGGGIAMLDAAAVVLTNVTISGNEADEDGGGVHIDGAATVVDFTNCTVVNNDAGEQGGGFAQEDGAGTTLTHCIVAQNTGRDNVDFFLSAGLLTADGGAPGTPNNLVGDNSSIDTQFPADLFYIGTTVDRINPDIKQLTNNTGETKTHALKCTSPAADATATARPAGVDQRDKPGAFDIDDRAVPNDGGANDLGAYELQTDCNLGATPNIAGAVNVCDYSQTYVYTVSEDEAATDYTWFIEGGVFVEGDGTEVIGQGTNTVKVRWFDEGSIYVVLSGNIDFLANTRQSNTLFVDCNGGNGGGNGGGSATCANNSGAVENAPYSNDFDAMATTGESCATDAVLTMGWLNCTGDDIDFDVDNGGTPSAFTGPVSDVTGGNYLYADASCNNSVAVVNSPRIAIPAAGYEMSVSYHLNGADAGTFSIEAVEGTTAQTLFTANGSQGSAWNEVVIDLDAFAGDVVSFRFTYTSGNGDAGDLAIDDFSVTMSGGGGPGPDVCNLTVSASSTQASRFWQSNGSATAIAANNNGTVSYAWDNGMTGATINNIRYGVYNVVATDASPANCTAEARVLVRAGGILGGILSTLADLFGKEVAEAMVADYNGLAIFPNPSNGVFNLSVTEGFNAASYTVVEMASGRQVAAGTVNTGLNTMNFSNLATGSYSVVLNNGEVAEAIQFVIVK